MNNELEIKSLLKEIFHQVAPEILFEKIDTSRPLRDQVEIDSYDFYRIIVQIAQRTGVNIPDSKVAEMSNLDQLIKYLTQHLGQAI